MGDVALRPVREDDLAALEWLINEPETTAPHNWWGWRKPDRMTRRWEESGLLGEEQGVLLVDVGAELIGFVSWHRVETGPSSHCFEIGVNLQPDARGHGHGTEAQRLLVRYLFAHTQVNRLEAGTELDNVAEQRALEKAGFTGEGVLRGYTFRNGRWRDCARYSILRDEVDLTDLA
ncbi:Protein N-acetyltransferase, RimJ/RimL family [Saccharopolyspora antimicrobica]|uniref:Protein N-acetyltransferase, RimJ/RimL family n=1 Tax=Saccharopolyspora antimicrobica TaxID=455193 RepID=A0A1I4TLU4_9PSEU|nr:GNAT family protein [Saccharopolyspora antimicrobica]RKT88466.1 RimJ/RimL family protein N-acetyltransferase [Saccharopolyspora antimicrobica]SFM77689.1 Protein N-acetyltransferase, RimJ/RimL family [Saccharopolyspora antimicrobica]